MRAALLNIFLCIIVAGCTLVSEQEQFVSSADESSLTRSIGNCKDSILWQAEQQQPGLTPDNIAILNWNIYKGQKQKWAADFKRLSQNKDIIFLQETPLNKQLRHLLHRNNLHWNMNSAFKYKGVEQGVMVASMVPSLSSCGIRSSEPILGLPKTILISRYAIKGSTEKLVAANIHGINFSLGTGAYQEQFDELQNVLLKHEGPIVLAGDFNNWSQSRTEIMLAFAERLSLQVMIFIDGERTSFFGTPVDHILYRGLEPVTNAVHPVTSSDHNPLSATFRLIRTQDAGELEYL